MHIQNRLVCGQLSVGWILLIVLVLFSCTPRITPDDVHQRLLTLDSHVDAPLLMIIGAVDAGERADSASLSKLDWVRMREGGLDAVFFAAFVGQGPRTSAGYNRATKRVDALLDCIDSTLAAHPDLAALALIADDAERLAHEGLAAVYLGIENGYAIGRELSFLDRYYNRGVRYITLCHTLNNDLCDSSTDPKGPEHGGLSLLGKEVVQRMNDLGMLVDLSHASDATFFDVLPISTTPVIASHSGARAVCDHPRNLSDEMLQALANHGGVVQVCLFSGYVKILSPSPQREAALQVWEERYSSKTNLSPAVRRQAEEERRAIDRRYLPSLATVADLVDHIDHIVAVAGIDHVGIGSDFDGGGGLQDCQDVAQMPAITRELLRRGYTVDEVQKIWSGNFLRVMRQAENNRRE